MTPTHNPIAKPALALAFLVHAGCLEPTEPFVAVTAAAVQTPEGDFTPNLEIEVHVYSADDDALIACATLPDVDRPNVAYDTKAVFDVVGSSPEQLLRPLDLADHEIYLWVIDRDRAASCPAPLGVYDDIIGRSTTFGGDALARHAQLAFERVSILELTPIDMEVLQ